ncbi:MAG: hypothetical protein RQM95_09580 [Syntrophaceticus schinkii]
MIPVQVKEIALDVSLSPVVLLVDEEENRALPIWVGLSKLNPLPWPFRGSSPPDL